MDAWQYIRSKEYYRRAVAALDRYADAVPFCFTDGAAKGMRAIEVNTGSGFQFTILPDRGLDIADARYCGIPIAYITKAGLKAPSYCQMGPGEFPRYFMAGLVTTCGFDNAGDDILLDGIYYPQHGRRTVTPAENVSIRKYWQNGQYFLEVSGVLRIASLFGENIVNSRTIEVQMGADHVRIRDTITNEAAQRQPYMLMYHCNFGFPIVSEDSYVVSNHRTFEYFDCVSRQAGRTPRTFDAPEKQFEQNVFMLQEPADQRVKAAVINPKINLAGYVECNYDELDCFSQWIQLAEQDYVLGLEPGKNHPVGIRRALDDGTVSCLEPGETHQCGITIGILKGEETADYEKGIIAELSNK